MDFEKLLQFASKNQEVSKKITKEQSKSLLNTKKLNTIITKKHEPDKKKGLNSAGVQAFLKKQQDEEKSRREAEARKKEELNTLRVNAKHSTKANAMASRTKENYFGIADQETKEQFLSRAENDSFENVKVGKNLTDEEKQRIIQEMQAKAKRFAENLVNGPKGPKAPKSVEYIVEHDDEKGSRKNGSSSSSKSSKKKRDDNDQAGEERERKGDKKKKSRKEEKIKTAEQVKSSSESSSEGSSSDDEGTFEVLGGMESKRHLQYDDDGNMLIDNEIVQKAYREKLERKLEKLDRKTAKYKAMDRKLLGLKHNKKKKHKKKHKKHREDSDGKQHKIPKIVKRAPPTISFQDILKKAEENRNKLVAGNELPEKPVVEKKKKKKEPDVRPMTAEEKRRADRLKDAEYQNYLLKGGKRPEGPAHDLSDDDDDDDDEEVEDTYQYRKIPKMEETTRNSSKSSTKHSISQSSLNAVCADLDSDDSGDGRKNDIKRLENRLKSLDDQIKNSSSNNDKSSKSKHSSTFRPPVKSVTSQKHNKSSHENILVCGPRSSNGDIKSSSNNSHKVKIKSEKHSSPQPAPTPALNPFDRVMNQLKRKNPTAVKKKKVLEQIYESEEEDIDDFIASDEEMDNFIDDSDAIDYSKEIKKIFGYDKHKYKDEDDDTSNMVANFDLIEREEKRSRKIGIKEDLEDIRREAEEERRKKEKRKLMKLKEKEKMKRR